MCLFKIIDRLFRIGQPAEARIRGGRIIHLIVLDPRYGSPAQTQHITFYHGSSQRPNPAGIGHRRSSTVAAGRVAAVDRTIGNAAAAPGTAWAVTAP